MQFFEILEMSVSIVDEAAHVVAAVAASAAKQQRQQTADGAAPTDAPPAAAAAAGAGGRAGASFFPLGDESLVDVETAAQLLDELHEHCGAELEMRRRLLQCLPHLEASEDERFRFIAVWQEPLGPLLSAMDRDGRLRVFRQLAAD
eukprot:GHVU01215367.1.p3 GENE.GHVU01215367.1~~GHVU01215367.1.p3  ORF type:complete len:146 (-),score=40.75 GHVU01215367.1:1193-1630(-)